jgi:hypothetical protein
MAMASKQSEAVRRHWAAAHLAMVQPAGDHPDNESWGDLTAEPRGVDYIETEAGGRPAMWLVPKDSSADRVLLCMHGGGFVGGSVYTHRKMFGHLAKSAGVRALAAALEKALRTDAAIELIGTRTWFAGRATCLRYLAHVIGSPGDWLMTPTLANGQPAAAAYCRDGGQAYHAFGLAVLTVTPGGITRIAVFAGGPALVTRCGLPAIHPGRTQGRD